MFFRWWKANAKKDHSLKVDIITLFVLLFLLSTTANIVYTYKKNYHSILEFSSSTIYRSGTIIVEKIEYLIRSAEKIPGYVKQITSKENSLSLKDRVLLSYFKQVMLTEPDFTGVFIGEKNGSFLAIANLQKTQQRTFATKKDVLLPSSAVYSIEEIDTKAATPTHSYQYLDKDFTLLAEEKTTGIDYDPRLRPWYIDAEKNKKLSWSEIYNFYPTNEPGITVSTPIYDKNGEILGVSAVDLSLLTISDFIKTQKIGTTGTTVIVDKKTGNILMPIFWPKENTSSIHRDVVAAAFSKFEKKDVEAETFEVSDITYLAGFRKFPLKEDMGWVIVMIAPLSDFFSSLLQTQKEVVGISVIIFIVSVFFTILLSQRISKPISTLALEIDKIKNLDLSSDLRIYSRIREINILDSSISAMRSAVGSFIKYVPKEIVKPLIKQGKGIVLGGEKKDLVIMFTDITGFTNIAETMPPDQLMPLLEEYFDRLSKIILKEEGTIDKYIGDSIMAFWGAPTRVVNPILRACMTALLCQTELKEFNEERKNRSLPLFITKIGIDCGPALVGNIGTEERINYTAIGDAVNTASRLQGMNNTYLTSTLVSERIYDIAKEQFLLRPIDIATVKGKKEKIKLYELMASIGMGSHTDAEEWQIGLSRAYTEAYMLYEQGKIDQSLEAFCEVQKNYPQDLPTETMIQKIQTNKL